MADAQQKERGKERHDARDKGAHRGAEQHAQGHAPEHEPKVKVERLIVRVQGVDLTGTLTVQRGLTKIRGIGVRMAKNIGIAFSNYTGIPAETMVGNLEEEQSKKLEEVVQDPAKFGVPSWALNRRKDFYTGQDSHLTMADLDLGLRSDLQRMGETKSYKGLRHMWGQPVRGQKTKSTHRGKGPVVGVLKKDVKAQAAPAKSSGPPPAAKPGAGAKPAAGKK